MAAGREKHLGQLDIVRLGAFLAVIVVHSVDFTQADSSAIAGGLIMMVQYGREVFFALTGFVLVHSVGADPLDARRFLRRRVPTVLVPYLVWSGIYEVYAIVAYGHRSWSTISFDLLTGGAQYHLYFLLVTVQLYLAFPLVLRAVRRTAHRAPLVLALGGVANLAWFGALQWVPPPAGALRVLWVHGYELLPTYGFYVLAGAYAAVHRERVDAAVRRYGRRLLAASAAGAALGLVGYVAQLRSRPPRLAALVLQPAMMLVAMAAGTALYVAGRAWVDAGQPALARVRTASDISFGVYLAHPLILSLLIDHGLGTVDQAVPAPIATVLAVAGCSTGAITLSWLLRRTPLSSALTGRPMRRALRRVDVIDPVRELVGAAA